MTNTPPTESRGMIARWRERRKTAANDGFCSLGEAVTVGEVNALIHFASERGLDPEGKVIVPLYEAACRFQSTDKPQDRLDAGKEMLRHYSALSGITFKDHVNGRTLYEARRVGRYMSKIVVLGLVALILGVFVETVPLLANTLAASDTPFVQALIALNATNALMYLNPFFWGAVGSCVFLMKRMSDLAAAGSFDSRRMQGHGARIFLGAAFAGIVVNGFGLHGGTDTSGVTPELINLTGAAVAFLCGLGVKVIYGTFERIVETAYQRIVGSAPRNDVTAA